MYGVFSMGTEHNTVFHLILKPSLRDGYYYSYFTYDIIEAQRTKSLPQASQLVSGQGCVWI